MFVCTTSCKINIYPPLSLEIRGGGEGIPTWNISSNRNQKNGVCLQLNYEMRVPDPVRGRGWNVPLLGNGGMPIRQLTFIMLFKNGHVGLHSLFGHVVRDGWRFPFPFFFFLCRILLLTDGFSRIPIPLLCGFIFLLLSYVFHASADLFKNIPDLSLDRSYFCLG